jgi:hypothetical protein
MVQCNIGLSPTSLEKSYPLSAALRTETGPSLFLAALPSSFGNYAAKSRMRRTSVWRRTAPCTGAVALTIRGITEK